MISTSLPIAPNRDAPAREKDLTGPAPLITGRGRILVVEEDEEAATRLAEDLELDGYEVERRRSGHRGLESALRPWADLVILELALSDLDGFRLLRCLRQRGSAVPVIVLSGRDHPSDRVLALRSGADDFVSKPYDAMELLARVGAVLRRTLGGNGGGLWEPGAAPTSGSEITAFGDIRLDPATRVVTKAGEAVEVTLKEWGLLVALTARGGAVVPRRVLLDEVWGPAAPDSHRTLDTHMSHLRQKLEDDPSSPRYLLTVRKVGFRLGVR